MFLKHRGSFDLPIIQGSILSLPVALTVSTIVTRSLVFFSLEPDSVARVLFGDSF